MAALALELVTVLAVMSVAWLCASLFAKTTFFKNLPELASHNRFGTLDGLRGFLALAVFTHHAAIHQAYLRTGAWVAPDTPILRNAGPIPVQLFFMITGFLFWGKAIRGGAKIKWRDLTVSRVARIAPLYLLAMAATIGLAAASVAGRFELSPYDATQTLIRLFTFGALDVKFFGEIDLMPFNAAVTWTLVYEWAFYVLLPFTAWFATARRFPFVAIAVLVLLVAHRSFEVGQCVYFLLGMAAAQIKESVPEFEQAKSPAASWIIVCLLLCAFVQRGMDPMFLGAAYLFPSFLLIVYGNTLFGLLRTPAAQVLGACSYSIYLIHGIFLYAFLHWVIGSRVESSLSPFGYWSIIFGATVILVCLCTVTFRWIEHPAIEAGKKLRRNVGPRRGVLVDQ